jgi:hypothetical protein
MLSLAVDEDNPVRAGQALPELTGGCDAANATSEDDNSL